jgi:carbamoyl-phosphate synthase small subunit
MIEKMAILTLSDGTIFSGESFGADVDSDGEVVFNTGMVGYPESLTDPSYRGQILVFTYPLIGNYGVPSEELNEHGFSKHFESEDIHVRGVICAQFSKSYSHHSAEKSLSDWLQEKGIPGMTGVDTRALTKKLREHGVMLGRIEQGKGERGKGKGGIEDPNVRNLVAEVSCTEVLRYEPNNKEDASSAGCRVTLSGAERSDAKTKCDRQPSAQHDMPIIVAYDCGMKRNIIRSFLQRGVTVVRVPWDFDLASADFHYDGVFISNGPGDPKMCTATIAQIQYAIEKDTPTFGICLGTQLMALAIGGDTYKLKYGHRGANQPCIEVDRGKRKEDSDTTKMSYDVQELSTIHYPLSARCIITSQNHGFAVSEELPKEWHVWWRNANDGTVEGIRHESGKFFAVQFHPEASPGPEDAGELFDAFIGILGKKTAMTS